MMKERMRKAMKARRQKMKKFVKSSGGFSLIELLIVLAILAVIAALSITMFGGIVSNSKTKADTQQAENLKRAIQTYIAESNDENLSALTTTTAQTMITSLQAQTTIDGTNADQNDTYGTYGPYLEAGVTIIPQDSSNTSWDIDVTIATQIITVAAGDDNGGAGPNIH
jgi:prepilin-type N-terminal cleavage/methylation domain-containing protein